MVRLDMKVSRVLRQLKRAPGAGSATWVPMILTPEWAARHSETPPTRLGPELLHEVLEAITGKPLPPPSPGPTGDVGESVDSSP